MCATYKNDQYKLTIVMHKTLNKLRSDHKTQNRQ